MTRERVTLRRIDVAQMLHISVSTFDRMRRSGEFPVPRVDAPGRSLWSRAAIATWLGGHANMDDSSFALLTMSQVAERVGLSRATAYRRLAHCGLRQFEVRLRSDRRYPALAIEHLLNPATVASRTARDSAA